MKDMMIDTLEAISNYSAHVIPSESDVSINVHKNIPAIYNP
jgi:hypothetical protein